MWRILWAHQHHTGGSMTVDSMPGTSNGVETFSTADFHDWRRHVSESFVPLDVQTDRPDTFHGDLRAKRIDCLAMRSEEHTSELQSLMRNSYAVFCLKTKTQTTLNYC